GHGAVALPGFNPQAPAGYKGGITRLRLVREGGICSVSLNDTVALAVPLGNQAFDTVKFGLSADRNWGTSLIYSVKVGLLSQPKEKGAVNPALSGVLLVDEDLKGLRPSE